MEKVAPVGPSSEAALASLVHILHSHLPPSAAKGWQAPDKSLPRLSTFLEISPSLPSFLRRRTPLARVLRREFRAPIPPKQSSMDVLLARRCAPSQCRASTNVQSATAPDARSPAHISSSGPRSNHWPA